MEDVARYTFSKSYFQILSVFVDEGTVDIRVKDILNDILFHKHIVCDLNDKLENMIVDYVKNIQLIVYVLHQVVLFKMNAFIQIMENICKELKLH